MYYTEEAGEMQIMSSYQPDNERVWLLDRGRMAGRRGRSMVVQGHL